MSPRSELFLLSEAERLHLRKGSEVKEYLQIYLSRFPHLLFLITRLLSALRRGYALIIEEIPPEVPLPQAARILNVPYSFLLGLIEKGELPVKEGEGKRGIPLQALLEYRRRRQAEREEALAALIQETEELGMYRE